MGWGLGQEREPGCRPAQAEVLGKELGKKELAEARVEAREMAQEMAQEMAEALAGVPVEAQAWEKVLGLAWAAPRLEECRLEEQEH